MKEYIGHINKAFESRVRLGIMSVLMVNDSVDFNTIKDMLQVTDGNLASHIAALEKSNYLLINKQFVGKKPQTTYRATIEGRNAFVEHLNALEKLIKNNKS
jgi:DNA-binding MarR family transcriptional regulator